YVVVRITRVGSGDRLTTEARGNGLKTPTPRNPSPAPCGRRAVGGRAAGYRGELEPAGAADHGRRLAGRAGDGGRGAGRPAGPAELLGRAGPAPNPGRQGPPATRQRGGPVRVRAHAPPR